MHWHLRPGELPQRDLPRMAAASVPPSAPAVWCPPRCLTSFLPNSFPNLVCAGVRLECRHWPAGWLPLPVLHEVRGLGWLPGFCCHAALSSLANTCAMLWVEGPGGPLLGTVSTGTSQSLLCVLPCCLPHRGTRPRRIRDTPASCLPFRRCANAGSVGFGNNWVKQYYCESRLSCA